MADICSKAEVISYAFHRTGIAEGRILTGMINTVQEKHVMPVLGEDLYDDVVANPLNYTSLLPYLKPIVAYFVKYYMLPEIYAEISNTGINKVPGNNRSGASADDMGSMKQNTLEIANMHVDTLTKYLEDNESSYPLYYSGLNDAKQVIIAGGIICRKSAKEYDSFYNNSDDEN